MMDAIAFCAMSLFSECQVSEREMMFGRDWITVNAHAGPVTVQSTNPFL